MVFEIGHAESADVAHVEMFGGLPELVPVARIGQVSQSSWIYFQMRKGLDFQMYLVRVLDLQEEYLRL